MAKARVGGGGSTSTGNTGGNGGIMGSGIFGMFGTTVQCKADDTSMFCTLSKFVNVIIMIFFLLGVLYLSYMAFNYFKSGGKMSGGRKLRFR
jgi:threonine/homoserine/homoserine lactone efflux protein